MAKCNFFILFILSCFLHVSCTTEKKSRVAPEIKTYGVNDLDYPEKPIHIPDTVRNQFIKNFMSPWNEEAKNILSNLDKVPGKDLSYLEKYLNDDEWYGENKKPHKKQHRQQIVDNASFGDFPNFLRKGIVTAHTDLRRLPTKRPGFDVYSKAGEGYPFDYFQETNLWANTPVLMVHLSKDKQWCFVISPYYKGWVDMHDLALANEEFIAEWSKGDFCMPLSNQLTLASDTSHYAINAKIGMVLPYQEISEKSDTLTVFYVNSDENQNARILKAFIDKNAVAFKDYDFSGNHLQKLVSNLIGQPYGWGGNLENRDCSSMIRDLLGTFRIWLPRDSGDQIEIGEKFDFPKKTHEKDILIKEKGIPFLTILRKKGHNMLYVGTNTDGEPLILHAIWGLKTSYSSEELASFVNRYPIEGVHKKDDGTMEGRFVIGESVITSVHIGSQNEDIPLSVLEEIYAMTNIIEP